MFMILFDLLSVYCFNGFKVEMFLSEPDTSVPAVNKLIMEASLTQKYICGYLLKEVSLSKIQKRDATDKFKSVYSDINRFLAESTVLLKQLRKSKINLENKPKKIKMMRFIKYYKKQLTSKTTQIEGIETILKILRKIKRHLHMLDKQLLNSKKTICAESQLKRMKSEAKHNINFLLKMYENKLKECTKV